MFPTKRDTGGLRVPLVSFTGRDHTLAVVVLPAHEFGKRSDVFRILMPTAPTRIIVIPRVTSYLIKTKAYISCSAGLSGSGGKVIPRVRQLQGI